MSDLLLLSRFPACEIFCLRFPNHLRVAELTLVIDGMELPLAGEGLPASTFTACGGKGTTVDGVSAQVPFDTLHRLASARRVDVRALGFKLELTPEDRRALGRFEKAISDGVTVR